MISVGGSSVLVGVNYLVNALCGDLVFRYQFNETQALLIICEKLFIALGLFKWLHSHI